MESILASVLAAGTWLTSAIIAIGLLFSLSPAGLPYGSGIVTAGIGLFILLPITRVTLMLALFVESRDYKFAGVAALVLTIIFASFAVGVLYR